MTPKVVLLTKPGYRQAGFSRGLLYLLLGLDTVCREGGDGWPKQLLLTAGSNDHTTGGHPLPRCEAVDVRTKPHGGRPHVFRDALAKREFLYRWAAVVGAEDKRHATSSPIVRVWEKGTKIITLYYFFWLEGEGTAREHLHAQVRKGRTIRL